MILDPHHYCADHGVTELSTVTTMCRGVPITRTYCRACRRRRERERGVTKATRSLTHCYRGHRKTAFTWRAYNGVYRCLTCQYARDNARARERRERQSESSAA